ESAELFVIGGMDAARAGALGPAGRRVAGFAAIRAFEDAADPGAVVREARAIDPSGRPDEPVPGAGER
ncbi:MAG TPA: hypothetical protein VFL12_04590, partial [Thermoanaerobaculia bacterium]|nr:hypothetical protein [Thermoanaerobaculia bacterium]